MIVSKNTGRPALYGGSKVIESPYGMGSRHDGEGIDRLRQCIQQKAQLPLNFGPAIAALRRRGAGLIGSRHAIPCSSGTAAIHTALAALGIVPGDEVITTPVTDAGTVLGIMQLNAIPVFADINPESLMIDAASIEPHIGPRTRAIVPVHFHGCPSDMDGIMQLAAKHDLLVMEDCAQSWLAEWKGRTVGSIGHAGAFSMNESKHVSVGEGGMLTTDSDAVADYADRFVDKSYRRREPGSPGPDVVALNYRMSELCAVLGNRQFEKIEALTAKRHQLGEALADGMQAIPGLRLQRSPEGCRSTYWNGLLRVDASIAGFSAEWLSKALAAEGVMCSFFEPRVMPEADLFRNLHADPDCLSSYRPAHLAPAAFPLENWPHARSIRGNFVCLKINEFMTPVDVDRVIEATFKIVHWNNQHS